MNKEYIKNSIKWNTNTIERIPTMNLGQLLYHLQLTRALGEFSYHDKPLIVDMFKFDCYNHDTGIDADVRDMLVEVSWQEDDRLEVTVPLSIPSKWMGWTPESRYEHSKRFWYSNVMLDDLLRRGFKYSYSICDGDKSAIRKYRVNKRETEN